MNSVNMWRTAKKVVLFGLIGFLTVFSGMVNRALMGDVYAYASVDRTVGLEAKERSQGVTTDGASWIFSGKTSLVKVSLDNKEILALNKKAIPDAFKQYGSKHIGGISYANGFVYAAIEDSKVWENPIIALFDGQTLDFTGKYIVLPGKSSGSDHALTRGVPWVTCDPQNGCFYVGECRNTTALYAYDLETFEYIRTIPLQSAVDRIQGAEMYNGRLYAATNDATRAVYQISLRTGEVCKYFDRIMYQPKRIDNFGGEGEGITVLPMSDGTVFHALNMGALFVDANLRHYEPVPGVDTLPEREPDTPDDPDRPPRPQVTYLDKYVIDILESNSYTAQTEMRAEGAVIPMNYYVDGDNSAVQIYVSDLIASELNLPSFLKMNSLRMVTKGSGSNAHVYLVWPGSYVEIEGEEIDALREIMGEMQQNGDIRGMLNIDRLEYCGRVSGTGYVCETYELPDEDIAYNFYFTSEGISRWEVIDMTTYEVTETMVISLKSGVSNKDAFKVSGKKVSMEDFVAMFEGTV